ncbi:MAG: cob(I)yrinic acid a,c-diamide adenosyltransferase [Prevotella sp.]|nr:cob(I)yrinic acid a,c-diamide adenosyltransferase [Prevotella sp.]MCM1074475.1 cob(I)yrinic acid a,c-diamide adenosyltransferase [Ruminococcus sp.]
MEKSKLYTGTGDAGTTSLVGGTRIAKDDIRLEAYGTIDELSSQLGLLLALADSSIAVQAQIRHIQNKLFNVGAYLATQPAPGTKPEPQGLTAEDIKDLEEGIDALDAEVPKANAFILPGGTVGAAQAHVARTVCRRAERHIIGLSKESYVSPSVIKYINRLSDFLFILARAYNFNAEVKDYIWEKD